MKYFRAENANRLIEGERFEPVEIMAGTMIGVLAVNGEVADRLVLAAANPKTGVEEITEDRYHQELKKKSPSFNSFQHSNSTPPSPGPGPAIKGKGALLVPEGNVASPPTPETSEIKAADSVELGPSTPPDESVTPPTKKQHGGRKPIPEK